MIVLDTNVVSALMRPTDNPIVVRWLDQQARSSIWTTAVTILEIRFGLLRLPAGRRRQGLIQAFEQFIDGFLAGRVLPFDRDAAEHTAAISAARRAVGRVVEFNDAEIAGVAISRSATLATRNVRHFVDLDLPLIDPWATTSGAPN